MRGGDAGMQSTSLIDARESGALCANCGIPLDSQYFDDARVAPVPGLGRQVILAHVELPPQYCGVLEYFAQFTEMQAKDPSQIVTKEFEWKILSNGRPLYPYVRLNLLVNPWGYGSFPVSIRLEEGATIELVLRNSGYTPPTPGKEALVGGRLVGRYWYNPAFGDVVRRDRR